VDPTKKCFYMKIICLSIDVPIDTYEGDFKSCCGFSPSIRCWAGVDLIGWPIKAYHFWG